MGFLDSIKSVSNAVSSGKELVSVASQFAGQFSGTKKDSEPNDELATRRDDLSGMLPERIEKLIRLAVSEGSLDEDDIAMLERVAVKEGLDPDEVVFIAKKTLKSGRASSLAEVLTPAKKLAKTLSEIDEKINEAIEAIRMGNSSGVASILDSLTGGGMGLAVSIGKSIFGKSDDEKVWELEEVREQKRIATINAVTMPSELLHVVELLEYACTQRNAKHGNWDSEERKAWKTLHSSAYSRAVMMAEGNAQQMAYIEKLMPPKKKFGLF